MYTQKDNKKINILGTTYKLIFLKDSDGILKAKQADGLCDWSVRSIYVGIFAETERTLMNLSEYQKKVIRHEIIHAFLFESGLANCSGGSDVWAYNEEMVDWIASQHNKLHEVFVKAGAV